MNIISVPFSAVIVPALARLQGDPDAWRQMFISAVASLILVMAPISAVLILMADDVVFLVLGSQWSEAVPIFRIFAVTMFVEPLVNSTTWIFVSLGRGDKLLTAALISCPVIILSFAVGLPWGAKGVALSYSVAVIGLVIPRLAHASRGAQIRVSDFLRATLTQYLSALIALCSALPLKEQIILYNPVIRIGFWIGFVYFVYFLSFVVISNTFGSPIPLASVYRFILQFVRNRGIRDGAGSLAGAQ